MNYSYQPNQLLVVAVCFVSILASQQGYGQTDVHEHHQSASSMTSEARDPHEYADGYTLHSGPYLDATMPPHMHGGDNPIGVVIVDRLEQQTKKSEAPSTSYEADLWLGTPYEKALLRLEGNIYSEKLTQSTNELLWAQAIHPYWDMVMGVRYDAGKSPGKAYAAFGIKGLAPYWFESELTGYITDQGELSLSGKAEYEMLFTQKLILTPRLELALGNKGDREQGLGSGLQESSIGLRLRYEVIRQFAPYIGIEWKQKFGETGRIAKRDQESPSVNHLVGGVRFWF